jgi:PadR family transcriptional regulator
MGRPQKPATADAMGTLDLLILSRLARGPMHGFGIAEYLHAVTDDLLKIEEGSLYPALHRMEQDGWVRASWGTTDKNRQARFYSLTALGRKQLADEQESWARLTEGVRRVLRYA